MKKSKTAILYALAAGSMWGTIGLFVSILNDAGVSSLHLTIGRMLLSSALLGAFLLIRQRDTLKIKLKDTGWFVISGVLCILFFNVCYAVTIEKTSMAVAAVLLYTSPVIVTIGSVPVFHEKLTIQKGIAVLFAVAGCAFVSGLFQTENRITIDALLWGMGAAIGYAMYSIIARILLCRYKPVTVLFYTFLTAAIAGMCMNGSAPAVMKVIFSAKTGYIMLLFAVTCNIIPYFLYNQALLKTEASSASIAASFEPLVAAVLGAVFFHETLTVWKILGISCILIAVFVINMEKP